MSITDELREHAKCRAPHYEMGALLEIADRIDAEHKRACDDAWNNGYEADYLGIEKWLVEHPQVMEHHGWIRLPKDADGEYIHIGDRVENNERVARIVLTDDSWEPSVYIEKLPNVLHEHFCNEVSHYKPPTVEDVLREFARECLTYATNVDDHEVVDAIEKYAERLQLKESE